MEFFEEVACLPDGRHAGNIMSTVKPFIISVTGAHSRVGKTTLCSILLKELKGFGAIKYTKTPEYRQTEVKKIRRWEDKNFLTSQHLNFLTSQSPNSLLIDDINILNQKGKDTAIFLESGAERVFWIQSPYNKLECLLKIAISRMRDLKGVIIEGNSPVDFITPSLIIFIIGTEGEIKSSAIKVSERADVVIINSKKRVSKRIRTEKKLPFLSTISQKRKKIFWINLIEKRGEIDEFLYFVKGRINKDSH
jgi:molybdopterin-guanine dinucleotide biosynthesis protein